MAIESFEELLRQLRARPEWREQLRVVVLSEQLLALPGIVSELAAAQLRTETELGQLIERVDALAERMDALTERVDALVDAQDRTEARMAGLVEQLSLLGGRLDRAIGYLVEQQYRGKAHAYFQTIARRIHVLTADELEDLLERAMKSGAIDEYQAREIRWADAVIRARRDEQAVFLVVEASVVVDAEDVRRAALRADLVSHLGAPAVGVAAGDKILGEAFIAARDGGVWLVTDGHVEAPPNAA